MVRAFRRILGSGDFLVDEESLRAYGFDASGLRGRPAAVLRPRDEEQLRRILIEAKQSRLVIVPRGSGTGIRGGSVADGSVLLDMRGFDRIVRLDARRGIVEVGAGVTIGELNRFLGHQGFLFPLVPEHLGATLGGLAARNQLTEESFLFGDWADVVERVECFDGLGRLGALGGTDVAKVIGKEGATGIMTKLWLRVVAAPWRLTMELLPTEPDRVVEDAERLEHGKGLLLLEYCDALSSALLGLPAKNHIVAAYANDTGSHKDQERVARLLAARKRLPFTHMGRGAPCAEEATVTREQLPKFLALCARLKAPCYGHLGVGILQTQLPRDRCDAFRKAVVALGAVPGGKYGYGRVKRDFVPAALRGEVLRLKDERDYELILNKGVLI